MARATGTTSARSDAELAAELVTRAAHVAGAWFRRPVETRTKTNPTDLVTEADREAEAYVVARLAAERPDDGVLGEEGAFTPGTSGRRWVIDPVDGTYNFVRGIDWWCSAVALVDGDELVLGAVHDPSRGETFVGGPGLGAHVSGSALPALEDRPLSLTCAATYLHPPYLSGEVGQAWARVYAGLGSHRVLGSGTLDAMALARGRIDLVFQHSVPDWDRLPGEAIIRAVGGEARTVRAGGVDWYVAGVPTAVAEACARLLDG
ncbi:MAG: inositol monophosphatase family protein [Nocardioides sp.]|uniref:inositol monophosphatase family protein n=1 Tax=Nocardioides sp. TaxID=35761 RepID=UPI003F0BEB7C